MLAGKIGRRPLVVADHHGEALDLGRGGGGKEQERERDQRLTKLHRVTWQPSGISGPPRSSCRRSGSSSTGDAQNRPRIRSPPAVAASRVPSGSATSLPDFTRSARPPPREEMETTLDTAR